MTDYASGEFNCEPADRRLEAENKIPSCARAIAGNALKAVCEFNANCREVKLF